MNQASNLASKLVARAWMDADFRQRLAKNPTEVFQEMGIEIADLVKIMGSQNLDEVSLAEMSLQPPPGLLADEQVSFWADLEGPLALLCVQCRGGCCC